MLPHNPTLFSHLTSCHREPPCALQPPLSPQTERALFMYEMTLHFNPTCAEAYNNLGVLYRDRENLEKAVECYMAALTIRPNFPQVRGEALSVQTHFKIILTSAACGVTACLLLNHTPVPLLLLGPELSMLMPPSSELEQSRRGLHLPGPGPGGAGAADGGHPGGAQVLGGTQ